MEPHLNYPPDADLRKLLRFEPDSGAIWLGERRMVLLHTAALSALRRDLITSVGTEHTRRLLTRMGYASGAHDAGFAHKTRGNRSLEEMFMVGPQLHMLEGAARVTPLHLKMDAATGLYEGEFRWDDSWEAHAHRLAYGVVDEPACWILLGYASGYTSAFMGKLILFKEIQCGACGDDHCHIVGKPIDEWPDGEAYRPYFEDDSLLHKLDVLSQQVEALKTTLEPATSGGMLIGASPAFQHAHDLMQRAARTQVTVLLTGETGVGKERFARALHEHSDRATGPFVAVNCAALPAELIEAELFGVEKGAYTGAHAARAGRFERAEGGTLFLDEVGDIPLPLQVKLLRFLQERTIERIGGRTAIPVDTRIVCATHQDLESMIAAGTFREDLFYRLAEIVVKIPTLAERPGDAVLLAKAFLQRFAAEMNPSVKGFAPDALAAIDAWPWPGNVRELENRVKRAVIMTDGKLVCAGDLDLSSDGEEGAEVLNLKSARERADRTVIRHALARSEGNISSTAKLLGISRPTLYDLLKQYDLTA